MSNIGITRMISDLFFGSSRERAKNKERQMTSKKLIALTIVALIGLTMCSIALAKKPPKPDPEPEPPYNPAITYVMGGGSIWVMNADGSNNTLVTEDAGSGHGERPRWSADGLKIAFNGYLPDSWDWGIYTINLDGSDRLLLPVPARSGFREWSPGDVLNKGEKIVFSAPHDDADPLGGPRDLFLISPDGTGGLVNLTDTPDIREGAYASWSPDAKSIAAICHNEGSYRPQWLSVYELGLDGDGKIYVANVRNINDEAAGYDREYPTEFGSFEWANKQDKFVMRAWGDLWIFDLEPEYEMRRITGEGREANFVGAFATNPTWSPDDSRIAFHVQGSRKYRKLAGIYVVDAADGANLKKLEGGELRMPAWWRYAEPDE